MAHSLIIVESPAKARTLKKYVGAGYDIKASVGHVVDLPSSRLGVDVDKDFEPEYEVMKDKKKVVDEIRKAAAKADVVYLASDPDREGEAIAWHLAQQIGKKIPTKRVLFNEFTAKAVKEALGRPTELSMDKFNAQQARRILDRLVGYKISPILWKKVRRGLSAGRVQSVALRLIVEREKEIRGFIKEEYWSLTAKLEAAAPPPFDADLTHLGGEKATLAREENAKAVVASVKGAEWKIAKVARRTQRSNPQPPFTTARLLRESSTRLHFSAQRTMGIAQRLYEGITLGGEGEVGLITYMRTDSTRISDEAMGPLRSHIRDNYGSDYLPGAPNLYGSKGPVQDAHEAIRPTSIDRPPERVARFLKKEELDLYTLIWNRFVASQMTPAVFEQTAVDIGAGPATFRANGSVLTFKGHLAAYEDSESPAKAEKALPPGLEEGQVLKLAKLTPKQHFTQPPPRYSEAGLIKTLEEKGIGRPSTYAAIMSTIQNKDYVKKEKGAFFPTDLGILVSDLLTESFPTVMDPQFTAQLEDQLDQVESGKVEYVTVLRGFYDPFQERLAAAGETMRNLKREVVETEFKCELCGAPMNLRWGKNGHFLACSTYPDCSGTKNVRLLEGGKIEIVESETWGEPCDKCGSAMVIKQSRFGRFLACSGYPKCKNAKPLPTGVACPKPDCGGQLVERTSKRGKPFFGCNNYPKCDFVAWDRPVPQACPQCGNPYMVEKVTKSKGTQHKCPKPGCGYSRSAEGGEPPPMEESA